MNKEAAYHVGGSWHRPDGRLGPIADRDVPAAGHIRTLDAGGAHANYCCTHY